MKDNGKLSNSSYEMSVFPVSKTERRQYKKEGKEKANFRTISRMNRDIKFLKKYCQIK